MMQEELHSLLKLRNETNRKIRTAKVTLRWLEGRLGAQSFTTLNRQSSVAPEQQLPEEGIRSAAQMVPASVEFEDWVDNN